MLWGLEVVSKDETVAEDEGVTFKSRTFFLPNETENNTVSGFTVYDSDDKSIEMIGGPECSLEANEQGLICIKGLWIHFEDDGIAGGKLYYGVGTEGDGFKEVGRLDDPRLQRQWNLQPILAAVPYAATD